MLEVTVSETCQASEPVAKFVPVVVMVGEPDSVVAATVAEDEREARIVTRESDHVETLDAVVHVHFQSSPWNFSHTPPCIVVLGMIRSIEAHEILTIT
jgi:hypothetical protein